MDFNRKVFWFVLAAVIFYFAFILFSETGTILEAFSAFNWAVAIPILVLIPCAYLIRAYRWDYLLREVGVDLEKRKSYGVFMAGLPMTISPGKLGELIKSYILKDLYGIRARRSIPVVFTERLADLFGILVLALLSFSSFGMGLEFIAIFLAAFIALVVVLLKRSLCLWLIKKTGRLPFVRGYAPKLEQMYENIYSLLTPKTMAYTTAISMLAWGLECLCLYLVFLGLGIPVGFLESIFIFAIASIIGVITMLPGGIISTELSMAGLITLKGVALPVATAATILFRVFTLWYGIAIGMFFLNRVYKRKKGNISF